MVHFHLTRDLFLLFLASCVDSFEPTIQALEEYNDICDKIVEQPFFKKELVLEKTWGLYYSWNQNYKNMCMNVTFKSTNKLMISRVRRTMDLYMQTNPVWEDATLYVNMGKRRHILLLTASDGVPGHFLQVPHFVPGDKIGKPMPKSVPLFRMVMKLILDSRYLILSDCSLGVTILLAPYRKHPLRGEIKAIGTALKYGDGFVSCATKNANYVL